MVANVKGTPTTVECLAASRVSFGSVTAGPCVRERIEPGAHKQSAIQDPATRSPLVGHWRQDHGERLARSRFRRRCDAPGRAQITTRRRKSPSRMTVPVPEIRSHPTALLVHQRKFCFLPGAVRAKGPARVSSLGTRPYHGLNNNLATSAISQEHPARLLSSPAPGF
jgi:hypothetical protein